MSIKQELAGVVKGRRRGVSVGVKEINRRARECTALAPWNRPRIGNVLAENLEDWEGDVDALSEDVFAEA